MKKCTLCTLVIFALDIVDNCERSLKIVDFQLFFKDVVLFVGDTHFYAVLFLVI